jgi:hypothetical protein
MFTSHLHALIVRLIRPEISIRLPEKYREALLFRGNASLPRAAGGNIVPVSGGREQRLATGAAFGLVTTVLRGLVQGQTRFLQLSSRRPWSREIFGSLGGASKRDYARRKKSSREGFVEICAMQVSIPFCPILFKAFGTSLSVGGNPEKRLNKAAGNGMFN